MERDEPMKERSLFPDIFSPSALDRAHHRRSDDAWIARELEAPSTCVTLLWRGRHLISGGERAGVATVAPAAVRPLISEAASFVFLGEDDRRSWFALDLPVTAQPPSFLAALGEFRGLRECGPFLGGGEASILAQARAMAHWHRRHRFCGCCGAPTRSEQAGNVLRCTAETCRAEHFPRTDPAIIVLVTNEDRCLLGRQPRWPARRYSTLAGFVEPGENLEAAVAREVLEEAGVRVDSPVYRYSQPWPFPCSLMLGFRANAVDPSLRIGDELADAMWLTREALAEAVAARAVVLPPPFSISHALILGWFREGRDPAELEVDEPFL